MLHETALGAKVSSRYLENPAVRCYTVDFSLAELSSKLARLSIEEQIDAALGAVEAASEVVFVTGEAARESGPLLVELRRTDKATSLADAVMLAMARDLGGKLVSNDPCFEGRPEVWRVR